MQTNSILPRKFRPRPMLFVARCGILLLVLSLAPAVAAQPTNPAATPNPSATPAADAATSASPTSSPVSAANRNAGARDAGGAAAATALPATPAATGAAAKPPVPLSELRVTEVTRDGTTNTKLKNKAGLYDTVRVRVQNLARWLENPNADPRKFILYLDSYPLMAVRARLDTTSVSDPSPSGDQAGGPVVSATDRYLLFDLERTDDDATQKAWRSVLNRPKLFPWPADRDVSVTIGYDPDPARSDEAMIATDIGDFPLVDVNPFWFGWFLVFLAATLALFFWLARSSDLLRENGPEPTGKDKHGKPNRRPFSLGRTQMAFWFFFVIASYLFIWMVTSDMNTITPTALALIGISATTALGSVLISDSKADKAEAERAVLAAERGELQGRVASLQERAAAPPPPGMNAPAATSKELGELGVRQDRLYKVNQLLAGASRGFFTDILSDAGGVSFHRFQIVAWTVALGFIFLAQVFNFLMMPEFNATLLGLMGISSGTYLGFKFPERQAKAS